MSTLLGIDIGGTAVKIGVVDESGKVLLSETRSVSFDGYKTPILDTVQTAIREFLTADAPRLEGIAVSATGQIDSRRGVVAGTCGNFPGWIGVDIKGTLERAFGLPVTVANDANCMLLGEVWELPATPPESAALRIFCEETAYETLDAGQTVDLLEEADAAAPFWRLRAAPLPQIEAQRLTFSLVSEE